MILAVSKIGRLTSTRSSLPLNAYWPPGPQLTPKGLKASQIGSTHHATSTYGFFLAVEVFLIIILEYVFS
jgi:hypothetical protein